ncbi:hypothetical protein C8Q78DRAFT_962120 [Trametes maxima]|nr:hypothetical protein C8Q78DRAFT_962120 [Trametes maxima]
MSYYNHPQGGYSHNVVGGTRGRNVLLTPSSSPPTGPIDDPPSAITRRRLRDLMTEQARKNNPGATPRNDIELLLFGGEDVSSIANLDTWVSQHRQDAIRRHGSLEAAETALREFLDQEIETTGLTKPSHDDPEVKYLSITPHTGASGIALSLRFWPGAHSRAEYYMDFVRSDTREPVNVPKGYRLWTIPDPDKPWLQIVSMELYSIEKAHGIPADKIIPGEEKFVLRDGLVCQLMHEEQVVMRFHVPMRPGAGGAGVQDQHPVLTPQ